MLRAARSALPLALVALVACGAVTDPLDDQPDARPITGDWYTTSTSTPPEVSKARIEGGGAPFFGQFRFPLHGRERFVAFRDAEWTGRVLVFTTDTDFGFTLPSTIVHWTATLSPEVGTPGAPGWRPARLTLAARMSDDTIPFTWDYFRRDDLEILFPALGSPR